MRTARPRAVALIVTVGLGLVACGGSDDTPAASDSSSETVATLETEAAGDQKFPDVVDAVARQDGETWAFDVTISSPYDTPERYADGWRVLAPDGTELGFRLLTHDHAAEQPFTRSLDGVEIPDDIEAVTIEGRDQANGFGGETFELTLAR